MKIYLKKKAKVNLRDLDEDNYLPRKEKIRRRKRRSDEDDKPTPVKRKKNKREDA